MTDATHPVDPFKSPEFHAWTRAEETLAAAEAAHDDAVSTFINTLVSWLMRAEGHERLLLTKRFLQIEGLPPRIRAAVEYAEGDALVFMPYKEYLRTDHWQGVRRAALERADHKCQTCSASKNLHVHHRTYDRRGYEEPGDVTVLCADCHKTFHQHRRLER